MMENFTKSLGPSILLFSTLFISSALAETWTSGFGQGVIEAQVKLGPGNSIDVACEAGYGQPITHVSFILGGAGPAPNSRVMIIFDSEDPVDLSTDSVGDIDSGCRACAAQFDYLIDGFKRHKSVFVRFDTGVGARFSLKGAAKAVDGCAADFGADFE